MYQVLTILQVRDEGIEPPTSPVSAERSTDELIPHGAEGETRTLNFTALEAAVYTNSTTSALWTFGESDPAFLLAKQVCYHYH